MTSTTLERERLFSKRKPAANTITGIEATYVRGAQEVACHKNTRNSAKTLTKSRKTLWLVFSVFFIPKNVLLLHQQARTFRVSDVALH
jgi:hypothetical protein